MKHKLLFTFILVFGMFTLHGTAQNNRTLKTQLVKYNKNVDAPLTSSEMSMLKEVYKDKLTKYVLSNPQRVKDFKHLLRNRLEIKKIPNLDKNDGKFTLLSSVELFNSYNGDLKRDTNFDFNTFNPLKYNLEFFRMGSVIYKIDNTDYFIVINSQTFKQ